VWAWWLVVGYVVVDMVASVAAVRAWRFWPLGRLGVELLLGSVAVGLVCLGRFARQPARLCPPPARQVAGTAVLTVVVLLEAWWVVVSR